MPPALPRQKHTSHNPAAPSSMSRLSRPTGTAVGRSLLDLPLVEEPKPRQRHEWDRLPAGHYPIRRMAEKPVPPVHSSNRSLTVAAPIISWSRLRNIRSRLLFVLFVSFVVIFSVISAVHSQLLRCPGLLCANVHVRGIVDRRPSPTLREARRVGDPCNSAGIA